jgi:hypothetical protein
MAAKQPGMKDLSVLQPGVPRGRVIAELGPPLTTHPTDSGGMDVFAFKQGYSRSTRTVRALGHATGTVMTGGLWEVAGIPIESWYDGTEVKLEVYYGPMGEVESVTIYEGTDALRGHILGPHVQLATAPPSMYAARRAAAPAVATNTPPPEAPSQTALSRLRADTR